MNLVSSFANTIVKADKITSAIKDTLKCNCSIIYNGCGDTLSNNIFRSSYLASQIWIGYTTQMESLLDSGLDFNCFNLQVNKSTIMTETENTDNTGLKCDVSITIPAFTNTINQRNYEKTTIEIKNRNVPFASIPTDIGVELFNLYSQINGITQTTIGDVIMPNGISIILHS